jgi:hypothetical protein
VGTATPRRTVPRDRLVQVRLSAGDLTALHDILRTLNLRSSSDALRVGLRLLAREAAEVRASAAIHAFYGHTFALSQWQSDPSADPELLDRPVD